jgi:hypothetical protein
MPTFRVNWDGALHEILFKLQAEEQAKESPPRKEE